MPLVSPAIIHLLLRIECSSSCDLSKWWGKKIVSTISAENSNFLQAFNTFSCSAAADDCLTVQLLPCIPILATAVGAVLQLRAAARGCGLQNHALMLCASWRGTGRSFGIFSPKDDDGTPLFSGLGFLPCPRNGLEWPRVCLTAVMPGRMQ